MGGINILSKGLTNGEMIIELL